MSRGITYNLELNEKTGAEDPGCRAARRKVIGLQMIWRSRRAEEAMGAIRLTHFQTPELWPRMVWAWWWALRDWSPHFFSFGAPMHQLTDTDSTPNCYTSQHHSSWIACTMDTEGRTLKRQQCTPFSARCPPKSIRYSIHLRSFGSPMNQSYDPHKWQTLILDGCKWSRVKLIYHFI